MSARAISRSAAAAAAALWFALAMGAAPQSTSRYPAPPESARYAREIGQARALANELIKTKQIPGLSVAVACAGTIVWSEGFGVADVEQGGTIEGGRAMLMMFPESKVVVALLANVVVDFGEHDAQKIGSLFIR